VSAVAYRERIGGVLGKIWETQMGNIEKASAAMAETIANGGLVHMFGSGHSVLPVQDMFPRYGAYPSFRPLMDMRLMWTNVIGSGGAKRIAVAGAERQWVGAISDQETENYRAFR
jgi:uncharacterized phosphosugar-binding protein